MFKVIMNHSWKWCAKSRMVCEITNDVRNHAGEGVN